MTGLALDTSDNVYVTGTFYGNPDFGGGPLANAGNVDGFVMQLDASGTYQWAHSFGGMYGDAAYAVTVSASSVAVVGSFQRTMTVNGTTLTSAGGSEAYVLTYGLDGSPGILIGFSGSGSSGAAAATYDHGGNIVVAGGFNGMVNFGDGTKTSAASDAFLVKVTSTGGFIFAKEFGASQNDYATGVTVDASDNVLLVGGFLGSVSFGGASPVNANSGNTVVAKYSAAGAYAWAEALGGATGQTLAVSSATNATGDLFLTGYFCGNVTFGAVNLSSVGTCASQDFDLFALRLAGADGTPLAAMRAGGSSQDEGNGISGATDGRHFVAGQFQGFADFGGTAHTSAGGNDAIVIALAPL